jgi:hypothetical protein
LKTTQITVGFSKPVPMYSIVKMLELTFGKGSVTVGEGQVSNGVPANWIVVDNERRK